MTVDDTAAAAAASCERLTVRYGRKLALDDVTLSVPAGSVYALLGRNGAGKSSAVRCWLGQQKPTAGRTALLGRDVWKHRAELMTRVGVVPEEPDAPPTMSAVELGKFCARLYPRWDGAGYDARLARFGVATSAPLRTLSKGQKGQVMLALALGHAPELLLLDDPTLGLDVVARRDLFDELIGELHDRGTTVVLTTHDLIGVERIVDHVGVLKHSRLALSEELDALKQRFRSVRFRVADGDADAATAALAPLAPCATRRREWGMEAVATRFADDAFAHFRATPGVAHAEAVAMSLELAGLTPADPYAGRSPSQVRRRGASVRGCSSRKGCRPWSRSTRVRARG